MPELLFCIYAILLIKIVGIFSLHFSFTGAMNYNIVPFVGSSFVPVLLNFVLFVPYGFLLLSKRISRKSVYILMERVRRWRWIPRYTLSLRNRFLTAEDIFFENAEVFSISDADKVMCNCNKNILYWGNSHYQYYVDFMELDGEVEDYRADISAEYQELQKMVLHYFE